MKTNILFLSLLLSMLCMAELPQDAVIDWNLQNAWRSASSCRERICINGTWQWRSEPRTIKTDVPPDYYWHEEYDDSTTKNWAIMPINGSSTTMSLDRSVICNGTPSLCFETDIAKGVNYYFVRRSFKDWKTLSWQLFEFDVLSQLEGSPVRFELQDARGFRFFTKKSELISKSDAWQHVRMRLMLPPGCKELKFIALRTEGPAERIHGKLWLTNLRVADDTEQKLVSVPPPQDDAWGHAIVPHYAVPGLHPALCWPHASDPAAKDPARATSVWVRRDVDVPQNWQGRRIRLHFNALATDAFIYCNGELAGQLGFDGGDVEVTQWATPGQKLTVSVLVIHRKSTEYLPLLTSVPAHWQTVGLNGDVYLDALPADIEIDPCRIITQVTPEKILKVTALVPSATGPKASGLSWRCLVERDGHVELTAQGQLAPDAPVISINKPWPQAICWDIDHPQLYTLRLQLLKNGGIIDELLPVRFGFREFKIDGKFFQLNGIRLNLRPCAYWGLYGNWFTTDAIRHWIRGALKAGYNYVYTDQINSPGRPDFIPHFLEICDEEGMLVGVDTLNTSGMFEAILQAPVQEQWLRVIRHAVMPNINHPSAIMWRMNMNGRGYGQDQNPYYLDGKKEFTPGSDAAIAERGMLRSNELVRQLDPTRPTYNHACGRIGELYTLNNYLGWPELQDLREWLKVWAADGTQPLFMAEQATPYPGDFQMRDPTYWWRNEPVMTEYGAIHLGDRAYELEEDDYVDFPIAYWQPKTRTWGFLYTYITYRFPPILDECSADYYEAMLPAWRTWGISGGVNAWENAFRRLKKQKNGRTIGMPDMPVPIDWHHLQKPGFVSDRWKYDEGGGGEIRTLFDRGLPEEADYFEPTLRATVMPKLIAPLYAYIGGPAKRWYTVEHAFRSGETIEKTVICINDRRQEAVFDIRWTCTEGDTVIASGNDRLTVQPAAVGMLPCHITVPKLAQRSDAVLKAIVSVDDKLLEVKDFNLEFHPQVAFTVMAPQGWVLYDPAGHTAKALAAVGITLPIIDSPDKLTAAHRGLVIGCRALDSNVQFEALDRRVRDGLRVIVFEQSSAALQHVFGLRTLASGLRSVNLRTAKHPVLQGLQAKDFKDWRGETAMEPLTAERPDLLTEQRFIGDHHVWRCSLEGVVASTVVEKPHTMSYIPLLDAGFDLRYMAMWETSAGKGTMLFSQLNLTDRTARDPVAEQLLRNIMNYMVTRKDAQPAELVSSPVDGNSHRVFLIKSDTKADISALQSFMQSGGTVVASGLNAQTASAIATACGFEIKNDVRWKNPLDSTQLPPSLQGISPAEIHWRDRRTVPIVTSVPANGWRSPSGVLADIPVGTGRLIWLSGQAEDFNKEIRPDLIFTHVNCVRLVTLALTNAGVSVGPDWASFMSRNALKDSATSLYVDIRTPHDDPYANMRW